MKRLPLEILRSRRFKIRQAYLATETGGRHVRLPERGRKNFVVAWFGGEVAGEKRYSNVRLAAVEQM